MTTADVAYIDSSALLKLVSSEGESAALRRELGQWSRLASSALSVTEVTRAVLRAAPSLMPVASALLATIDLVAVTRARLNEAALLQPPLLRTLDALHLASARAIGPNLGAVVTYDRSMAAVARFYGMPVLSPGSRAMRGI
ncbi:MAG TPA: type II toxin-antitoxin system VapC family toxin [Candidatus Dormibacteraeota bacterium]